MACELKMPALSPTMEKGVLAKWLVGVGDVIRTGDLVAEIETDKATMEIEAENDGRVAELLVAEGTGVAVGATIALLSGEGEIIEEQTTPRAAPAAMPEMATLSVSGAKERAPAAPSPIGVSSIEYSDEDPIVDATPLARRIAAIRGIELVSIAGTGARGRITKADLGLPAIAVPTVAPEIPLPRPAIHAPPSGVPMESVKLTGMRKVIAHRLTESKQTIPHFYLTVRCRLDPLLKLRAELNEALADRGVKLSVNDMLIKAMAVAMVDVPEVNVQFGGEELYRFDRVDISMAVAVDGGLLTPIIKDAASLSLSAIAQKSKALALSAREGELLPEDYQGGTASISNLGMFGIDEMFPVINPPQALILGIGAGIEQPWKIGDAIGLATIAAITGSFDHRVIDGATAARFLATFRTLVENPVQLVA